MRLTVIGCAGTFPGPDSACSAYLVEHEGFRLLLDLGNGALSGVQRAAGLLGIDAVYLSHLHPDHCLDLLPYSYARRYHPERPLRRLPVHGPKGTQARLVQAFESPPADGLDEVYDFATTAAGDTSIGPFDVTLLQVNHPVECYGIRLSAGGRTLTYSADTGVSDALVALARHSDLFVCEASFRSGDDNPEGVHLTGVQAGLHAARADTGRLLLTHLVPWADGQRTLDEATGAYDGPVELAAAGRSYDV